MSQYPYKQKEIADNITELKPYDFTRQLDSISRDMGELSRQTAKMAEQNFLNTFEIESRKALFDCYERNQNNPKQLETEQAKIMQKYVAALPNKELRDTAKLKFQVHALGYLGKAKENLYNQQFKQLQATTLDKTKLILNGVQENGKDLYNKNLAVSGTAATAIGENLTALEAQLAQKDERGNMVISPHEQAQLRNEVRQRLTASDLDHFNGLDSMAAKEKFYKEYKDKKTKKIWLDPEDERGYSEQGMSDNNTDWPTYERNLAAMERELEVMKKEQTKGMGDQESGEFAYEKIAVLERLDGAMRDMENDAKYNPMKVIAFLGEVNDFGTNDKIAFRRKDGAFSYWLEPKEAYEYRKKVLDKYWDDTLESFSKQPDDTNFSYGLKRINQLFDMEKKYAGLNEFDKMEIMGDYYRELSAVMSPENMQGKARWGLHQTVEEVVDRTLNNYVASSKKFNAYARNQILSTPPTIKTTVVSTDNIGTNMLKVRY